MSENYIKFLGTAGARFVVSKQIRSSGGVFIHIDGKNIILDPGPGTLVRMAKSRPKIDVQEIDTIILTHLHIDHSNDINIIIDGMTLGGIKKKGILFAPEDALFGENRVVLTYIKSFLSEIRVLKAENTYHIGEITFSTSIRHIHQVETYGIKFKLKGKILSFMVDTRFFPELLDSYRDSNTIVMNVVRYNSVKGTSIQHLSAEDVVTIANQIRPERIVLTHFGSTMLKANPYKVAQELSKSTGIEIIAASDGMKLEI